MALVSSGGMFASFTVPLEAQPASVSTLSWFMSVFEIHEAWPAGRPCSCNIDVIWAISSALEGSGSPGGAVLAGVLGGVVGGAVGGAVAAVVLGAVLAGAGGVVVRGALGAGVLRDPVVPCVAPVERVVGLVVFRVEELVVERFDELVVAFPPSSSVVVEVSSPAMVVELASKLVVVEDWTVVDVEASPRGRSTIEVAVWTAAVVGDD